MSKANGELKSWEQEIAILIANAMQAGIAVWNLEEVQSMGIQQRASVMAGVTRPFVLKVIAAVERQFGTKSSS